MSRQDFQKYRVTYITMRLFLKDEQVFHADSACGNTASKMTKTAWKVCQQSPKNRSSQQR